MTSPGNASQPPKYKRISFVHETPKEYVLFINFQLAALNFDLQSASTAHGKLTLSMVNLGFPLSSYISTTTGKILDFSQFISHPNASEFTLAVKSKSYDDLRRILDKYMEYNTWGAISSCNGDYRTIYFSRMIPLSRKKILSCLSGKFIMFATTIKCDCYNTELEIDAHHQCLLFNRFQLKEDL